MYNNAGTVMVYSGAVLLAKGKHQHANKFLFSKHNLYITDQLSFECKNANMV